ncbi:MAG: ribonuclease D [Candidatus Competibacteraceae bacterium]|nr:ribonuclease D [Candidatus Competibacteraceae bacterium]
MNDALYIVDQPALLDFCARLGDLPWLAVDTEFVREKTYYPQLCLIQVAVPGQIACIDPLAVPSLEPLLEILCDPRAVKVLHAAYQDLEIFFQLRGAVPAPVFDTQLAALVLGHGHQLGYAALVEQMLGVRLEKAHTRADWRQRPLASEYLTYAADDVRYLGELYTRQQALLRERGWLDALAEDFRALAAPDHYRQQPREAWRRIRDQNRLRGVQQAALRALAAWREHQASHHDRPRRWIVDDAALIELARRLPETPEELRQIRALPTGVRERQGQALLEAIAAARAELPEQWPAPSRRRRFSPAQAARAAGLLELIESRAAQYGIWPGALTDRRDIEAVVFGEDSRLFHGWRAALLGRENLAQFLPGASD